MTDVIRMAPLFVLDGDVTRGMTGALAWRSSSPGLVTVCAAMFEVHVSIEGFTVGLFGEHVEPWGGVTIAPRADVTGVVWLAVDVEDDGSRVVVSPNRAWEFLADVALAACVNGVRLPERVDGLEDLPHLRDGGAL